MEVNADEKDARCFALFSLSQSQMKQSLTEVCLHTERDLSDCWETNPSLIPGPFRSNRALLFSCF